MGKNKSKKIVDGLILTVDWSQPFNKKTGKCSYDKTKVSFSGLERNYLTKQYRIPLPLQYSEPISMRRNSFALSEVCEIPVENAQYLFNRLWELGFRKEK